MAGLPSLESGWDLAILGLAPWLLLGAGAARRARERGYPVIWLSVLLGPVGWAAMARLTRPDRPSLAQRQELVQQAAAGLAGLPVEPAGLPASLEPALEAARRHGAVEDFWQGVADYGRFERLWDRALPWLVLVIGGGALAGAAAGALPVLFGMSLPWALGALPGALAGFALAGRLAAPLESALARGREEALSRCAVRAGEPGPPACEGAAAEAADRLRRLQTVARVGAAAAMAAAAATLTLRAML